jgi:hypothetical protein
MNAKIYGTNYGTPWSGVLDKLTCAYLVKNSPNFMAPGSSLPHLQKPATCPYVSRINSFLPPFYFLEIHFNIALPSTPRSSRWSLFPQVSPPNPCTQLSSSQYLLHDPPISSFLFWSPEYLVRITDNKTPCHVVFSTPLLPRPSKDQTSPSALSSQTSSAYLPPSVWENTFHTHTKQQAK